MQNIIHTERRKPPQPVRAEPVEAARKSDGPFDRLRANGGGVFANGRGMYANGDGMCANARRWRTIVQDPRSTNTNTTNKPAT